METSLPADPPTHRPTDPGHFPPDRPDRDPTPAQRRPASGLTTTRGTALSHKTSLRRRRPLFEVMEARMLLSNVVTRNDDAMDASGHPLAGTLRAAILKA